MTEERKEKLDQLVNEVTNDEQDLEKIKELAAVLNIPYSEDPLQLLNNVLKGIHTEGPKNESSI
jgi:hypothetical protein